jgi:hypothetical protein
MSPAAHFNDLIQTLMPDAKVFAGYGHDPMIDASNLKFSAFSFLVTPWVLFRSCTSSSQGVVKNTLYAILTALPRWMDF